MYDMLFKKNKKHNITCIILWKWVIKDQLPKFEPQNIWSIIKRNSSHKIVQYFTNQNARKSIESPEKEINN